MSLEVRVRKDELGPNAEQVLLDLADLLDVPVKSITQSLQDKRYYDYQPKPVAEFVPERVAYYLREHPDEFPGVSVVPASVRAYPWAREHRDPEFAAHVLGYLGQIQGKEYEDPKFNHGLTEYGQNDLVGRSGLEQVYEKYLRGEKGAQKYIVNSDGETIRTLGEQPATPGDNLVLALDADVQQAAEEELQNGIDRARTIVDEQSGTYLKADGGRRDRARRPDVGHRRDGILAGLQPRVVREGPHDRSRASTCSVTTRLAPSLNRVTQQVYAPGSTFKPFVALSAFKEGSPIRAATTRARPSTSCRATRREHRSGTGRAGQGSVTIASALKYSCDTVFYDFGTKFFFDWRDHQLAANSEPLPAGPAAARASGSRPAWTCRWRRAASCRTRSSCWITRSSIRTARSPA